MLERQVDERAMAQRLLQAIASKAVDKPIRIMEVCGTHTMEIFRSGIRQLLPAWLDIVSGPGCPVCVTPNQFIDQAIAYARRSDVIITTFGDMMRVPGSSSSLNHERSQGRDIRIVYSPLDSLQIARANPAKQVIFLGVGFETTAPVVAATVIAAEQAALTNFFVLSAHKAVPPALRFLLDSPATNIAGFLLPGHVCVVTGEAAFRFVADEYHVPAAIAGFKPLQILTAIYHLVEQIAAHQAKLVNDYQAVVTAAGNRQAVALLEQVYKPVDSQWRGLGRLNDSGLAFTGRYQKFAAEQQLPMAAVKTDEPVNCRCGEILQGIVRPVDCKLFGSACTPGHPVGSCMVSSEGTCAAWYKYGGVNLDGW